MQKNSLKSALKFLVTTLIMTTLALLMGTALVWVISSEYQDSKLETRKDMDFIQNALSEHYRLIIDSATYIVTDTELQQLLNNADQYASGW